MCIVLVVQSEQHVIYRLMADRGGGGGGGGGGGAWWQEGPSLHRRNRAKDCREWKLMTVDPQERSTWRSGVRSAMGAASQVPVRGPTDVDGAPPPAC